MDHIENIEKLNCLQMDPLCLRLAHIYKQVIILNFDPSFLSGLTRPK